MFDVIYHEHVVSSDISKLSTTWKDKIRQAIESRLQTRPDFYGKPLRRSLKGYRKLRVGDYRVIFLLNQSTVKILMIEHRSIVYSRINQRIKL